MQDMFLTSALFSGLVPTPTKIKESLKIWCKVD